MSIIELFIVGSFILYGVIAKRINVIALLLFALPFNSFIKNLFEFTGGGQFFPYWKELLIFILFIRSIKYITIRPFISLIIFMCLILFSFLFTEDKAAAIATFRDHMFSALLFLSVYSISVTDTDVLKIMKSFLYAMLVVNIIGIFQMTFFHDAINLIMARIAEIDSFGNIDYTTSSFKIMGIERMSSILEGPNSLGMINAMVLLIHLFIYLKGAYTEIKGRSFFLLFTLCSVLFSLVALIASFSRAGVALLLIGSFIMSWYFHLKILKGISIFAVCFVILVSISYVFVPKFAEVTDATLSGKEASAADRSNNVSGGFNSLSLQPFGNGLGTADYKNPRKKTFTESIVINTISELGFITPCFLLLFFFKVYFLSRRWINNNKYAILSLSLLIPSLIVSVVSVNCYTNPYLFSWWIYMAIGCKALSVCRR